MNADFGSFIGGMYTTVSQAVRIIDDVLERYSADVAQGRAVWVDADSVDEQELVADVASKMGLFLGYGSRFAPGRVFLGRVRQSSCLPGFVQVP